MSLGLDGRIALVTGGTRGVGLAVAGKLAAEGCDVLLAYAGDDRDAVLAVSELRGDPRVRGNVAAFKGDLRRPTVVRDLLEQLEREHGALDVLVHCAASLRPASAHSLHPDELRADLDLALTPLLADTKRLTALMTARGRGRIIAVTSIGARRVIPAYAGLGVAKAAMESLVRYLAAELAGEGVCVNAVSTGKLDKGPSNREEDRPVIGLLAGRTPAGRLTTPADVADAVALLCADEAAWIHGQVITVDGGLSLMA
ncbi:SDR family oxidoreductase [Actinomadura sp. ATCC 31491]|uniref:SDR family oxidoreductase n=1 Tax=Actinomadura luzonensis TaxID=2805427 RepID=A0ABT0G924_9ACTN|nr:SDR family oxidoreductase [Actinomadura luzonensis]MCK2221089.1 SDR family oxidoreductase [Actinomadura luzonensis]